MSSTMSAVRCALLTFVALRYVDGLGDTFLRNQAITFLSARSGWRIYESNSLDVNPNLSIAPLSFSPNANQRAVLVSFGAGTDPVVGLATVGTSASNLRNKHHTRRGYDLDSIVLTPVPTVNATGNGTVPGTPMTLTFVPVLGHITGQCMVARINMGASAATPLVSNVITNLNPLGGSTCAIFVRNSTDTGLLDSREIRKCEVALRKCARSFKRLGREHDNDFVPLVELTTLTP